MLTSGQGDDVSTTAARSGQSLRCAERLPKIQNHPDADAGVGDVKGRIDVTAEMEVDEVDDVAVEEAIDEVAQNTAAEETEDGHSDPLPDPFTRPGGAPGRQRLRPALRWPRLRPALRAWRQLHPRHLRRRLQGDCAS